MCALLSGDACIQQLDGVRLSPVRTDPKGVVNQDTIFTLHHRDGLITAEYLGGSVIQGYFIGRCSGSSMEFSYCQMNDNGNVTGGRSHAELALLPDGRLRMVEHFTWEDGTSGVNILEQIAD